MTENTADPSPQPSRRKRSSPYPGWSLSEAEELARITFKLGGKHVQQDAVAAELGYSNVTSGSYKTRRAAAGYFGMVDYEGFDYINVAEEWLAAFHSEDEQQLDRVRQAAFLKPDLYRMLFDEFKGKMLPHAEKLARHLFLNERFGIRQDAAPSAADSFLKSASYAGYLDGRGFLTDPGAEEPNAGGGQDHGASDAIRSDGQAQAPATVRVSQGVAAGAGLGGEDRLEIRLGGARKVYLIIPPPGTLSQSEKDRVKAFVDLVLEEDADQES